MTSEPHERVTDGAGRGGTALMTVDLIGDAPDTGAITAPVGRAQVLVEGRPLRFEPHNCFACGSLNVGGLQLVLHVEGPVCWTELDLPERFQGWEGIAHGGIVCTILDEVMAWALVGQDAWGLTARMTVEFKRPVPVGAHLRAEGRLAVARRRLLTTTARLTDASTGELLATAEALYMAAPPERKRELKRRYGFDEEQPLLAAQPESAQPESAQPESAQPEPAQPETQR